MYKIGDKIRCIKISPEYEYNPVIGKVYEVSSYIDMIWLVVYDTDHSCGEMRYRTEDFKRHIPYKGTLIEKKVLHG